MDLHWRNTQKTPRFFMLDARSAGVILMCMVYIKIWTLVTAVMVIAMFYVFERAGLSFGSAIRAVRCYILGRDRPANHRRSIRRYVDFG